MAVIVKKGTASPVSGNAVILGGPTRTTIDPPSNTYLPPAIAGEALGAFDACHFSQVDGMVYRSYGGGATAYLNSGTPLGADPVGYTDASLARVHGYPIEQVFNAGDPVQLTTDVDVDYCNVAQAVGKPLYVSTTLGALQDATSTNGTVPVAVVLGDAPVATTSKKIRVKLSL